MKKILIVADGIVAKHFLARVCDSFVNVNEYTIVTLDKTILPEKLPSNFMVYEFDPTSYIKLSSILKKGFDDIFVILKNRLDAAGTYENIRRDLPETRIAMLNRWDCDFEGRADSDPNLIDVNANEIIANRLYDFLPNVPVIAQNVGLGQGEIIEVLVPFGSAYVYRHVGTIIQNQWRIIALYRQNQLILPTPSLMIKPNDVLVLVGKPKVLESVFKAIKREQGQFPAPFGESLYLYLDMALESPSCITRCLEEVSYLHKRIKGRKLYIRVARPTDPVLLGKIRALDLENDDVECLVDYRERPEVELISNDIETFNVGLVICGRDVFDQNRIREHLYNLRKPVLQMGDHRISRLKKLVLILGDDKSMESVSSTVYDVASQQDMDVELYDYEPDGDFERKKIILQHYENLAVIFSRKLQIRKEKHNPIRRLRGEEPFLQTLPFTRKILQKRFFAYFSTDAEKLYFQLSDNPQLFIPVEVEE